MKHSTNLMLSISVIGLMLLPARVLADFKSDIIASCSAYQQGHNKKEINACKLYIDGFIDSSLLTENAVIAPKAMIEKQPKQLSAYLKRAYKTRVNDSSLLSVSSQKGYQFCIAQEYDRTFIASRIAKSIDINQLTTKPLREVLFETLTANFPCP